MRLLSHCHTLIVSGFRQTRNLIRFTRLQEVTTLGNLLNPGVSNPESTYRRYEDVDIILRFQRERLERMLEDSTFVPRQFDCVEAYQTAIENKGLLSEFAFEAVIFDLNDTSCQ